MPRHPLSRLSSYARKHRRTVVFATLSSLLNKAFDLAPPVLIGAAIDVVVERDESLLAGLGVDGLMNQLTVLAIATVIIWGLESAFEYGQKIFWRNLAQTLQHELRVDAYAHVQKLELQYFEDRSTGGLMAVLNDDINQLERFLDGGANEILQVGTTVVLVGIGFFGLEPTIAAFAFLPIPLILWGSFYFQRRIAPRYQDVRERVSDLNAQLSNSLTGIATIKSFATEEFEVARVEKESDAYRASNRTAIRLSSAFSPLIRMAIVVGFTATLVYGGYLTQDGRLAVGAYGVLVFMTQRLLWPLTRLGTTVDLYQRAMASTARVLNLLDTEPQIVSGEVALSEEALRGDVAFDGVSFSYQDGTPVLSGLTLRFAAGETTAIVGATGSGKSTIVKLLLRFYDPDAGAVRVGGEDVRTVRLEDLRGGIGLVSQDVFLFHGTVRENIAYGSPDADEAAIVRAAKAAEAHDFIAALPDGYDTVVGERGQKLSGGQRQRVSIARAVLKDPPILILDEATSSVDNETEAAIQRSMAAIAKGRTTIVIAHRLSTVRGAARIYVLDEGQVTEVGHHEELLKREGIYAALWKVQTGEAA
ncbi:MAG: ABC transporter ATP-binding protein [Myxococcota bacterium]